MGSGEGQAGDFPSGRRRADSAPRFRACLVSRSPCGNLHPDTRGRHPSPEVVPAFRLCLKWFKALVLHDPFQKDTGRSESNGSLWTHLFLSVRKGTVGGLLST